MSLLFVSSLVFSFLLLLPLMQQPISFVVVMLIMAGSLSAFLGLAGVVWYGFSLFLIYVGGLLVMFGYVVVLVPNFVFSWFSVGFVFFLGVLMSFVVFYKFDFFDGVFDMALELYSDMSFVVLVGLGVVLFLALVCVVKVCYFHSGSLRPFVA
uniref:NADH dehydrogenase subunit 6 n=1 Tax=Micrura bella TaxID=1692167 RepID=A0A0U2EZI2_9BILA|nr:NADH dehydrogenase subunit 6 [Micrura bella]AKT74019.1 NADH dehydrogenase subunit 6 [Micrura bella]